MPASLALRTLCRRVGEFERRNGVAVFLFRGGHPIPYRRKALKGLTFVVYDRIRSKAVRHCFERARIFNPNVMLNRVRKPNRRRSSLSYGSCVSTGLNGLDCVDKKMSLELRNGKNPQKSKVLTFE